ncbi:small heat shock protein, class I [Deferribacter desulfuricans SSM1]|uniref:Small heat shock protein, class I n=1 Tax=Deferribacter desulfuricans (strain DSM 14783 / JCM 11476 / NBRC 101012 / SSM1) TaxID=639282 RepID=D3P8X3_DEFDS|nr:Hsp20/alpha crystallin family protein [Deferribacter desulfuricans]BAI81163.1 small heat shock protein, class I [Deferribacter desulfuricans SSM1]
MSDLPGIKIIHGIINNELGDILKILENILNNRTVFESNYPLMDIAISKDKIKIYVDLPGVKLEDFKVYLYNNNLIIEGFKSENKIGQKVNFLRMERDFFPFRRVVQLPESIYDENITAILKNGVLEIIIDKK